MAVASTQAIQKWEYMIIETPDDGASMVEKLNRWGREGWELVSVTHSRDKRYGHCGSSNLFFKRPAGAA